MQRVIESIVRRSGVLASRLLVAGFLANAVGRIAGLDFVVKASHALSLAGLGFGGLWLGDRLYKLARSGDFCVLETYLTMGLWALSPWGLVTQAVQLAGEAIQRLQGDPGGKCSEGIEFYAPFKHCWIVVRGGVRREESHSWGLVSQRYAYDMIRVEDYEKLGSLCRYRRLSDWATYGAPVLASADGVVVAVRDGVPDNEPVGRIRLSTRVLDGNYVVIKHSECAYTLYAHLRRGSIVVREEDKVRRGEAVGEAGNSGMSTAPHLHFQLMTNPSIVYTRSIPVKMTYTSTRGEKYTRHPRRGEVVCPP